MAGKDLVGLFDNPELLQEELERNARITEHEDPEELALRKLLRPQLVYAAQEISVEHRKVLLQLPKGSVMYELSVNPLIIHPTISITFDNTRVVNHWILEPGKWEHMAAVELYENARQRKDSMLNTESGIRQAVVMHAIQEAVSESKLGE